MKISKIITQLLFIKYFYLDEIVHYRGYSKMFHKKDDDIILFPAATDPTPFDWEIISFYIISETHFYTHSEKVIVKKSILFIMHCICLGLTVRQSNVMLGLSRKLNVTEVSAQLDDITPEGVKKCYESVCQKLNVTGYKNALDYIHPNWER